MKITKVEKKKIAIVGCGKWSKKICSYLEFDDNFELDSIVCKNINNYKFFKNKKIFNSIKDLINTRTIDGIYIAGTPSLNLKMIQEIIEYNIPTILEKPISDKYDQAKKIYEICMKKNFSIILNQSHFYDPIYNYFKMLIKNKKEIKKIIIIEGGFGPFRKNINPILDWGIHSFCSYIDLTNNIPKIKNKITVKKDNYGGLVKKINLIDNMNIEGSILTGNLFKKKTRLIKIIFEKRDANILLDLVNRKIFTENNYRKNIFSNKKTSFDNLFNIFLNNIQNKNGNKKYFNIFKTSLCAQKLIEEII